MIEGEGAWLNHAQTDPSTSAYDELITRRSQVQILPPLWLISPTVLVCGRRVYGGGSWGVLVAWCGLGLLVGLGVGGCVGECLVEELEWFGCEEAAGEGVEEWVEDVLFFDADGAWVAGAVGGGGAAEGDVAAAVPVGAFLVA